MYKQGFIISMVIPVLCSSALAWGVQRKPKSRSNGNSHGSNLSLITLDKAVKIFHELHFWKHDSNIVIGTILANPNRRGLIDKNTGVLNFENRDARGNWPSEVARHAQ